MDVGGSFYLRDNLMVWFVVFTWRSVRAIHLELLTLLSADASIQVLQRFINRRGVPLMFISDHRTNLATRYVREKNLDTQWQFVVERGPWWGEA